MQYRDDIDGLRAIAVILILFFHLRLSNVPGGFVGVDVFFVISGFLITGHILREMAEERFTFRDFYLRRLRRLGPALLVTVGLTLLAGWFILPPTLYQTTAQAALATLLSVSNVLFWQQTGYFDIAAAYKPLLHTWSLAVEEQFYLVWPTALVIGVRLLSKAGLLSAIVTLSAVSLGLSQMLLSQSASASFYLTPFRIFAFGAGAILAVTGWQARSTTTANIASLFGLLLIFYVAGTLQDTAPFPGINGAIPAAGTALMIYAGPSAVMNRVMALAPIRYIGRISYSVYLLHWPLIVYYIFLYGQAQTTLEILRLIALTLMAGAMMYHIVERPFRQKQNGNFAIATRKLGLGSLATALALALASWQINAERGYPARYSPQIRDLLAALNTAISERTEATGEFDCNATENSKEVYFDVFADCLPRDTDALIAVLGDSHAADVYMGLRATFPDHNIVQLTGNGCNLAQSPDEKVFCAPFFEFWETWLAENADHIIAVIYSQSVGSLVSRGAGGIERPDAASIDRLAHRIERFRIPEVPFIFWGPRPGLQPTIDIAIARSDDLSALRNYYAEADFGADFLLDRELETFFGGSAYNYVSSARALCTPHCPTLTTNDELFVVDYGHWTLAGARQAVHTVVGSDPVLETLFRK